MSVSVDSPPDLGELITKNMSPVAGRFLQTGKVGMRLTPAMALRLLRQCIRHGMGVSGYVRRAVVLQLEQDEATDPAGK